MTRAMTACLLAGLLIGGQARADESRHLSDLLGVLGLTRSDLAIGKRYLPDPDRLAITDRLTRDPLSSDDWLREEADHLRATGDTAAVLFATRLLGAHPSAVLDGDAWVDRLAIAAAKVRLALRSVHDLPSFVDLVHPGRGMSAGAQDRMVEAARSIVLPEIAAVAAAVVDLAVQAAGGPKPRTFMTPFGRVSFGSTGSEIYTGPHALIVDPGGDDLYRDCAGATSVAVPVSVVVDLAGDDTYRGRIASGYLGVGVVVERGGDDTYAGATGTIGAGIGGVGVLFDEAGDDHYETSVGGQGFGIYGVGVVVDSGGDDLYAAEVLAQGCAGPGGAGLLLDRAGNDAYHAGGRFKDFRESGAHPSSMSQGFSIGLQTEASAGAGVLMDLAGNDRYEAGYFAQGASHWAGVGALFDGGGDDRYSARRYAQGCGTHLSAGILVDVSGGDVYSLWAVGQGCGHDLAVGMLTDDTGDDRYAITWLGQGAGSANGTGILIDREGDDAYAAEREDTQGHGVPNRGFGSVGLMLDLAGTDSTRDAGMRLRRSGVTGGRYDVGAETTP